MILSRTFLFWGQRLLLCCVCDKFSYPTPAIGASSGIYEAGV